MRVAIYARVSTEDKGQDPENQLRDLAGMRKAAAKGTKSGKPIGRPRVDAKTEREIQRLLRGGTGINKTAATVGVGTATVQRVRAEMGPFESAAAA